AVLGDRVFVSTDSGLTVGQLNRGATPSVTALGSYLASAPPLAMAVHGSTVVLALGPAGLEVVDATNGASPVRRGTLAGNFVAVFEGPGRTFVQSVPNGVAELDLSNPVGPRTLLGSVGQPPLLGVTADGAVTTVPLGALFGGNVGVPFTGAARVAAR